MRTYPPAVLLAGAIGVCASADAADWTQFGYDSAHSGNNTGEAGYSSATGNVVDYSVALSAPTDSAPVFLSGVTTAPNIKTDLLFVAMKDGTLAALNASNGAVVWSKTPAPVAGTNSGGGGPSGSPVIDPSRAFVYSYGLDGKIHKYAVADGSEPDVNWPVVTTVKPEAEKSASSLSIGVTPTKSYLYSVTNGYDGDGGNYQGHLTAIDLSNGHFNVFNTLCSNLNKHFTNNGVSTGMDPPNCGSVQNGIWGRPGAVYDASLNRVYIVSGNGEFNADTMLPKKYNWGDSILAVSPDGSSNAGDPLDSFTPNTAAALKDNDADLGSASIALLPVLPGSAYSHIAVQAGKDSCLRLINLQNMSSSPTAGPRRLGGELQAIPFPLGNGVGPNYCTSITEYPSNVVTSQPLVWTNPADASIWVFIANKTGLIAYKETLATVGTHANTPQLSQQWVAQGGTSPVMANGTLYYAYVKHVRALNPTTGAELWLNGQIGQIHWQSPIVVNGHLYVIDQNISGDSAASSKLWSFHLDGVFKSGFN